MIQIIPSPIPQDFADLSAHLSKVKELVSRVQIDVLDGRYAPPVSWPYNGKDKDIWSKITSQEEALPFWELLEFEIDLMVETPEGKIDDWISAGAGTLIVHVESTGHIADIIERAKTRGAEIALALKPKTSIDVLAPWIDQIAFVQLMGNDQIGQHGVALDPSVVGKIQDMRERYPGVTIGIDIGVNEKTIPALFQAGATRFASYSAVYKGLDIAENIKNLEALG